MSVANYKDLYAHKGHKIAVVVYAGLNVACECETCNEVLIDFDNERFKE